MNLVHTLLGLVQLLLTPLCAMGDSLISSFDVQEERMDLFYSGNVAVYIQKFSGALPATIVEVLAKDLKYSAIPKERPSFADTFRNIKAESKKVYQIDLTEKNAEERYYNLDAFFSECQASFSEDKENGNLSEVSLAVIAAGDITYEELHPHLEKHFKNRALEQHGAQMNFSFSQLRLLCMEELLKAIFQQRCLKMEKEDIPITQSEFEDAKNMCEYALYKMGSEIQADPREQVHFYAASLAQFQKIYAPVSFYKAVQEELHTITYPELCDFLASLDEPEENIEHERKIIKLSSLSDWNVSVNSFSYASYAYESDEAAAIALFESLPITEEDKKIIDYIITTTAEGKWHELLRKKEKLEKRGDKIRHVHPFRFLQYVFSKPHLKNGLRKIKDYQLMGMGGIKWKKFLNGSDKNGFVQKMKKEAQHNNLMQYVPGFSRSLNINADTVRNYIKNEQYEGLLRYLIHTL